MASNKKFSKRATFNQLKHVTRDIKYPKNIDIDKERTHLNYSLSPERNMTDYEYLKKRLGEVEIANDRQDRVYMSGWVITKPVDLNGEYEDIFFEECYNFLKDRYGEKNVISANVHKDESGQPHMHFCFAPITEYTPNENLVKVVEYFKQNPESTNTKASKELGISRKTVLRYKHKTEDDIKYEKLSAKSVINKKELITFHSDLQNYLDKKRIPAKVNTGITKKQGGNMTVEQLKMQRNHLMEVHNGDIGEIIQTIDNIIEKVEEFEL